MCDIEGFGSGMWGKEGGRGGSVSGVTADNSADDSESILQWRVELQTERGRLAMSMCRRTSLESSGIEQWLSIAK